MLASMKRPHIHTNSYRSFKIHSKTIPFFEKAKKVYIEEEEKKKNGSKEKEKVGFHAHGIHSLKNRSA